MTDAEYETQRQRLLDLADKWIKPIGLGWYKIDHEYARDDYEPPDHKGTAKENSLAHCHTDWRYGTACITWNMPVVKEQNDADLETAYVHELSHIFLHEMRWTAGNEEDSLDHEERVASTLTKAFLWLRDSLVEAKDDEAPAEVTRCKDCGGSSRTGIVNDWTCSACNASLCDQCVTARGYTFCKEDGPTPISLPVETAT